MASASWAGGDNPSIEACAVHVGRAGRATIRTGYTIPSSGPGMQHWYHPCPVWALTVIKWWGVSALLLDRKNAVKWGYATAWDQPDDPEFFLSPPVTRSTGEEDGVRP